MKLNITDLGTRMLPSRRLLILILAGLIVFFFAYDELIVRIDDINQWDEANYIIRGRSLVQGEMPEFSWSPFTAAFFAILYLPFQQVGNWLPTVASLGRVIIYLLAAGQPIFNGKRNPIDPVS